MANKKLTDLTALGAAPASNDLIPIVDVSDTTDATTGTNKKMTVANLFTAPTIADQTNANHNHSNAAGGGQLTDAALSSAVGISKGGTGQTTATAAFDALAPTTTGGDIIYHDGTDNVRLAKGTAGQVLQINSGATAPEWGTLSNVSKLYLSTTEVAIASSATETTLFSTTVTGGSLSTNNGIRFKVYFSDMGWANAATLTIRVKYGATTILQAANGSGNGVDASGYIGILEGYIVADGATNAQKGAFQFIANKNKHEILDDAVINIAKVMINDYGTAAIDSTANQTLTITAQYGAASASSQLVAEFAVIELIK